MKVICIIKGRWWSFYGPSDTPDPKFGETCTVIKSYVNCGIPVYDLLEYKGKDGGYQQSCFIPCSDIDELELVNEKEEVV